MASTYPGTIDTFTNPAGTNTLDSPDHAGQHSDVNDAMEAVQAALGTTAGTSVIKDFTAGDFPVRQDSSNVLQDTITGGTINSATFGTPAITGGTATSSTLVTPNVQQYTGWQTQSETFVVDDANFDAPTYSITAPSDLTSRLSKGMRVRVAQDGADYTESVDLEASSSQYGSIADASQTGLDITGDISISLWTKPEALDADRRLVAKWNPSGNKSYDFFYDVSENGIAFQYSSDGTNESRANLSNSLPTSEVGKWVHLEVTVDVSTKEVKGYVNGVLKSTITADGSQTSIYNSAEDFAISAFSSGANNWDGIISDVKIFNDIRTAAEVMQDMVTPASDYTSGTANFVDGWSLDGDWTSVSGNNDLTASGSPSFVSDTPGGLTDTYRHGIISADPSYSSPDTTVTLLMEKGYGLIDGTITSVDYSTQKAPFGFPLDPDKWSVEFISATAADQATPTANTWYNLGSISITIPIGLWDVSYQVLERTYDATSVTEVTGESTLSTAADSESDENWTCYIQETGSSSAKNTHAMLYRNKTISLTAKDIYYLNARVTTSGVDNLTFRNNLSTLIIKATTTLL